ncbi:hypothetical protein VPH35_094656 [Triticum aestivum]
MLGSTDASAEPKRPRHADDGAGGDAGDDRLSALPDDLLCVILSRLKAQQTVRTCVLSTRWRRLWSAVPCLEIDRRYTRRGFDDFTLSQPTSCAAMSLRSWMSSGCTGSPLSSATSMASTRWKISSFPVFEFENLTSFSLDGGFINDDFLGLREYLHNSPNLQKLTLRHCKEVMKRRQSYSKDLAHFKCNNLRLTEIIRRDGDASVDPLVKFFRGIRTNLPNNKIKLISLKKKKKILNSL